MKEYLTVLMALVGSAGLARAAAPTIDADTRLTLSHYSVANGCADVSLVSHTQGGTWQLDFYLPQGAVARDTTGGFFVQNGEHVIAQPKDDTPLSVGQQITVHYCSSAPAERFVIGIVAE